MILKERKNYQVMLHILGEFGALVFVIPFLLMLLNRYKFKRLDKIGIWVIIIVTLIVDGYLLFSWFNGKESFENDRKDMIRKLIRSSSRYSLAAKQDLNSLVKILHANYGAADMFSLKNLFSEKEIEEVLGSEEIRKKYEKAIIEIQDKSTREAVKKCPEFTSALDFLAKLGGEA